MVLTKLVVYHATPDYHKGHELNNILVAAELIKNAPKTFDEYLKLCNKYGTNTYIEEVFNDFINQVKYI